MKTLNIIFLAASLCASSQVANAEGKFSLGVQGGLTFPDYRFKNTSPAAQYNNKDGWLVGAFAEMGVWSVTLRPEINYVTKPYSVGSDVEVKNHYIEVPLLLKFNPFGDFVVSPFFLLGPQWSKQIDSEVSTSAGSTTFQNTVDGWDIAAVAGAGVEFNVTDKVGINVQGRYAYGFRDIDGSAIEAKPRAFYLLGGLSISM